jgi:hypothetical protein
LANHSARLYSRISDLSRRRADNAAVGKYVAKANLGRTLAEGDKIRNQKAQAYQTIETDVRNSIQALRSAESRLNAAVATRTSAEQLYESEQRQFRSGTTTLYLVLQRSSTLSMPAARSFFNRRCSPRHLRLSARDRNDPDANNVRSRRTAASPAARQPRRDQHAVRNGKLDRTAGTLAIGVICEKECLWKYLPRT